MLMSIMSVTILPNSVTGISITYGGVNQVIATTSDYINWNLDIPTGISSFDFVSIASNVAAGDPNAPSIVPIDSDNNSLTFSPDPGSDPISYGLSSLIFDPVSTISFSYAGSATSLTLNVTFVSTTTTSTTTAAPTTAAPTTTTTTAAPTTTTTTAAPTTAAPTTAAPTTTTTTTPVVCFLAHMPVLTPSGYSRIDSLKEGDLVLNESGKSVAIQRVKVMRVRPGPSTNPYVIPAGTFGATEDVLISPRHKVAVGTDGKMVEARDLGLKQKSMKAPFNYYNLEISGWSNMRVAGVEVESLAPAKRVTATVDQVKAAIAALPASQRAAVNRLCRARADGMIEVFGAIKK